LVLSLGGGVASAQQPAMPAGAPGPAPERVGWSAGPVALGTGFVRGTSERVREVQISLRRLGYPPGPIDGLFGPRTEHAVLAFQRTHALAADGIVGPRTLHSLRRDNARLTIRAHAVQRRARPAPPVGVTGTPTRVPAERPAPSAGPPWAAMIAALVLLAAAVASVARAAPAGRREAPPTDTVSAPTTVPAAPAAPAAAEAPESAHASGPRLGELLQETSALRADELAAALEEQRRSGGRLGEILVAYGVVPEATLTSALARQLGVPTLQRGAEPVALLAAEDARTWRAVALDDDGGGGDAVAVAVADPTTEVLANIRARLDRPIEPKLCDAGTLDELLNCVYADVDADEVTRVLRDQAPELSAFRTSLSRPQSFLAGGLAFAVVFGGVGDRMLTATVLVAIATAFFVASTGFRFYAAWRGSRPGATVDPPAEELAAMDERSLPVYTILLPLYKEKPSTIRALFGALSRMDYPKHKLDGLLLIEADDDHTRRAIEEVGRPAWMRVLPLPPGTPRTKPRAMGIGLRYAKGTVLTVYDAEDKPDPAQLKKAVWGFQTADESLACLQAKLGYYNPRQNLLTRWFTLEYDAWFNIFLPGLHRIGAPIPLGGTSNHFRRDALDACLGWDPYNVTEDADLGLRFARLGLATAMLESTTEEEANSRVANWLRQRSRWSKGYMQTALVHTRRPLKLVRELGPKATVAFLLTVGGAVVTALLAPIFWLLLLLWVYVQPDWIAAMFPGPIYYAASLSLVLGNFLLIFLSLCAAVTRGHDDLAPHALLIPLYWALMSAATYFALVELFVRPSHWHKTEHGLHLAEEAT
jgi:cellulose synthase/poly-beta-1,6-N-acetylglucosamine synthase-like glycosyltransferase/peptidoglycan hydrolase-like protein with peptidoglycan-binding domain